MNKPTRIKYRRRLRRPGVLLFGDGVIRTPPS
jgi:hypothetical protein